METPGTVLRCARKARRLSLDELATITRIPRISLSHLEEDAYDELPAEVFVRGFLRNISRELKIDAVHVVRIYESYTGRNHKPALSTIDAHHADERSSLSAMAAMSSPRVEPLRHQWNLPSFDRLVEVVGSAKPGYVIGALVLLLGVALTISVMANGAGSGPSITLGSAPPTKASWDVKADGAGNSAPWIVKGQTNNLAGAATLDLSRPAVKRKANP